MIHKVYLALGSNMGERQKNIFRAIELLREKVSQIKIGGIYETTPFGYTDQGDFLNTAIRGEASLSPQELLDFVKVVEKQIGRIDRFRWGPREIDIDIIFYDDIVIQNNRLEIPHPRAHERDFVLRPLADIDSDFRHPNLKKTIGNLLEELTIDERSVIKKLDFKNNE